MRYIYLLTFFHLHVCALAQKNFFDVPSADIVVAGKFFAQMQAAATREDINTSLGATYGLGYNAEIGITLNQWNFQQGQGLEHDPEHPEKSPDVLINAQKAFALTTDLLISFGTRSGINGIGNGGLLSFANFTYAIGHYTLKHHIVVAGIYYANSAYEGDGHPVGFMAGADIQLLPDKLHLICDYTSGDSPLSAFTAGLELELSDRFGISLGGQWPAPRADADAAGIMQLSWDF